MNIKQSIRNFPDTINTREAIVIAKNDPKTKFVLLDQYQFMRIMKMQGTDLTFCSHLHHIDTGA